MRVFRNAIFEVGPGEYVIGVRTGENLVVYQEPPGEVF